MMRRSTKESVIVTELLTQRVDVETDNKAVFSRPFTAVCVSLLLQQTHFCSRALLMLPKLS